MIRMPNIEPDRTDAIVQPPDLMPTILEMAGAKTPDTVQGKSLLPLMEKENPVWRDFAVSSPSIIHGPVAGQRISVISREWFLVYCGLIDDALRELPTERRIRIVDGLERLQKVIGEKPKNELYNLSKDPDQLHDVFDEHRDIAEELHKRLVKLLESVGTTEAVLKYWRELA